MRVTTAATAATTYIGSQGHTVWNFGNGNNGNVYQISGTVCSCYCPITGTLQCNLQDSLCTYDMGHSAKYGAPPLHGLTATPRSRTGCLTHARAPPL